MYPYAYTFVLFLLLAGLYSRETRAEALDSLMEVAQERIATTNKIIRDRGLRWNAAVTSKSYLYREQWDKMCGFWGDTSRTQPDTGGGGYAPESTPDWTSNMSSIEDQGEYGICWAHAATGVAEALIHSRKGSNIGIDMDELEMALNASCGDTIQSSYKWCGLSYIQNEKARSEQGINIYPNYNNGYWTISSYDSNTASIDSIKKELANSPVLAVMDVFADFADYDTGVYVQTSQTYSGAHYVVIVSYSDADSAWKCKNSYGSNWGENGYFRIKYGECGIDQICNFFARVSHESCYAKIIPTLIPHIDTAMSYGWATGERAYVRDTYTMTASQTVSSGKTLEMLAGATMKFPTAGYLTINGTFLANGTSGDSVEFTSSAGTPTPGSWYGIKNYGTATIEYGKITYPSYGFRSYAGATASTLDNCLIKDFATHGLNCADGDLTVTDCEITDCSSSSSRGMYLYSSLDDVLIEDNVISNLTGASTLYGIYVSCDNSRVKIRNNEISNLDNGSTRYGINVRGDSLLIEGNTINGFGGTTSYGIYVYAADYDTLRDNVIKNSVGKYYKGIYLTLSDYAVLESDTVANCASRGIEVYDCASVTAENCVVQDCDNGAYAIYGYGSSTDNLQVIGSHVKADTGQYSCGYGLVSTDYADIKARRNTIEDFWGYGLVAGITSGIMDAGTVADSGRNNVYWNLTGDSVRAGVFFIYNAGADTMKAEYNYYGSASPPSNRFAGKVDWSPYLTGMYYGKRATEPDRPIKEPVVSSTLINDPNPFNINTTIRYEVTGEGKDRFMPVRVDVYSQQGRFVVCLVEGSMVPGKYSVDWDGRSTTGSRVEPGMYLARLKYGGTVKLTRIMLTK